MQDDFEKELSRRMQEFSISPQPEIWQQVEAGLPEKKRRRFALWWLITLVAGIGIATWWLSMPRQAAPLKAIAQQEKNIQQAPVFNTEISNTNKSPISSVSEIKPIGTDPKPINAIAPTNTNTDNSFDNAITNSKKISPAYKAAQLEATVIESSTNHSFNKLTIPIEKNDIETTLKTVVPNTAIQNELMLNSTLNTAEIKIIKADSIHTDSATITQPNDTTIAKNIVAIQKDSAVSEKKPNKKNTVTKKSTWLVDASPGISWLKGTSSFDKAIERADYFYNSPTNTATPGTGIGTGSSAARFSKPSSSFSFRIGAVRQQKLNEHFSWQVGLYYQLLSATQFTGASADSPNANNAARFSSIRTYRAGNSNYYKNVVHQLQFAPGMLYVINPMQHSPVLFSTGLFASYNINSNLLLHDYVRNLYVRSRAASATMQYGTYVGMDIFIHKKIQLGVLYQHSFSNVANANLGSDYRWRKFQIHTGFPIFNH